jgi:hypothetical protein
MRRFALPYALLPGAANGGTDGSLIFDFPHEVAGELFSVCSITILTIRKAQNRFRLRACQYRLTTS